jgi:hypothetical protein
MDNHTLELVLGIGCVVVGSYMAFAKKHYRSETWRPTELSEKLFGQKRITSLVRFQGTLVLIMGIAFLAQWVVQGA